MALSPHDNNRSELLRQLPLKPGWFIGLGIALIILGLIALIYVVGATVADVPDVVSAGERAGSLLEALATGLPVIASAEDGGRDTRDDRGHEPRLRAQARGDAEPEGERKGHDRDGGAREEIGPPGPAGGGVVGAAREQ